MIDVPCTIWAVACCVMVRGKFILKTSANIRAHICARRLGCVVKLYRCDVDVRDARPTLEAKTRVESVSALDHFDICFPRRIVFVKSYGLEHHTHVSRTLYSYLSDDMHLIHGAHVPVHVVL